MATHLFFPLVNGRIPMGQFDYLGEAEWPQRCGNFGIIDIAAIPKDAISSTKFMDRQTNGTPSSALDASGKRRKNNSRSHLYQL